MDAMGYRVSAPSQVVGNGISAINSSEKTQQKSGKKMIP